MIAISFFSPGQSQGGRRNISLLPHLVGAAEKKELNDTMKQNALHGVSGVMFALSSWLPPLPRLLLSPFLRILPLRFCISSTLHKFL